MGDPRVVAALLIAAASAALVARLAFGLGGRAGRALLVVGAVVLVVANVRIEAFSDVGRLVSGATLGFAVGAVVGLVRFGLPGGRRSRDRGPH